MLFKKLHSYLMFYAALCTMASDWQRQPRCIKAMTGALEYYKDGVFLNFTRITEIRTQY